jgi:preprotein translocase subunit SecD
MEIKELAKEWRIWVLIAGLAVATFMLMPDDGLYDRNDEGDVVLQTALQDRLGIEFTGGTRLLLSMETNATGEELQAIADQSRDVLSIRMRQLGLPDPSVRTIDLGGTGNTLLQVQTGAQNQDQVAELISQEGSFAARMPIKVENNTEFTVEETWTLTRDNDSIIVKETGNRYRPGDSFRIQNETPEFVYVNNTESYANVEVTVYDGSQVEGVSSPAISGPTENGRYNWQFSATITSEAARNLNQIAQNYNTFGSYLSHQDGSTARMRLYVDGQRESALSMSTVFADQVITRSQISGGSPNESRAEKDLENMQAILQSGSLPVDLNVETVNSLSSALGGQFLRASMLSILGSLIAVGGLVTLRYQNLKVAIPIVFTGAAEVYILLGTWFTTGGTLTLSAIAGIIAAVGTGVDDQIIITDESDREVISSWTEKMKRAFFVIFTSAASTIGAMSPIIMPGTASLFLAIAGVGLLAYNFYSRNGNRHFTAIGMFAAIIGGLIFSTEPSGSALSSIHDFAWTTIFGILIGIAITRPAFAKVIEQIDN